MMSPSKQATTEPSKRAVSWATFLRCAFLILTIDSAVRAITTPGFNLLTDVATAALALMYVALTEWRG